MRNFDDRSGFEPELGGELRERGVYVDEVTCIGCKSCAHVAPNTFTIEAEHGRSRVFSQDCEDEAVIQEAIDTCPVDCIHLIPYDELKELETKRRHQKIRPLGFPQINPS